MSNQFRKFTITDICISIVCIFVLSNVSFKIIPGAFQFISPLSDEKINVLSLVRDRVQQKMNIYKLKNVPVFISRTYAASSYDNAAAYAVVDFEKGEIIAEKDVAKRLPIASLTKIMTAVTALDLIDPDETISISENATNAIPTKLVFETWEQMTVRDLLNAVLLTSANDAAQALQDGINAKYGAEIFIDAMNMKAEYIGLKNSHFANPQGFDDRHNYSTVEDLVTLSHYALSHYPLIADIVKKDAEYMEATDNHKRYVLYNWNGLVGVYPNTIGMKIGNTGQAGTTTVAVSEREGKKILTVVLGAPGVLERDMWAAELLDVGYEKTLGLQPVNVTEDQLREKYATWVAWN